MVLTVKLNHQLPLNTTEIDDVRSYRMLSTELQTAQPPIPQTRPDQSFRFRGSLAEIATALLSLWLNVVPWFITRHRTHPPTGHYVPPGFSAPSP